MFPGRWAGAALVATFAVSVAAFAAWARPPATRTISIVGTTDLHGFAFPRNGRGGLALLGGYLDNLRAARAADGGAVLLLDAGDTYQGGIESNLSEGAMVVDAYNALGYTAAAIGNHEFDFGAIDVDGRRISPDADPQGALKAIAARARFPLLAANLVDDATGLPVAWPNVRPSVIVDAAGIKVGLVGAITHDALQKTIVAFTRGLHVTPLAPAIVGEATRLRRDGATVVVVVTHAGGSCRHFDAPDDLSSCDDRAEIFEVARALPAGLVDAIVAGHSHGGLAHLVNGIPIVEAYSRGRAFGRIDLSIDGRGAARGARLYPLRDTVEGDEYEGAPVVASGRVTSAMQPALNQVGALQAMPLGTVAETPILRADAPGSPLGNLVADAIRTAMPGADVAIANAFAGGGLRADLPAGPVTFGRVYDVFPFDNQLVQVTMTAGELAEVLVRAATGRRRGIVGLSGVQARGACTEDGLAIQLARPSGVPIAPGERLSVATTEMIASGPWFPRGTNDPRVMVAADAPLARDAVTDFLRRRGGHFEAAAFEAPAAPRWAVSCEATSAVGSSR